MSHTDVDVVIVGASLSGLAAAEELHRAGVSVAIIEAASAPASFGVERSFPQNDSSSSSPCSSTLNGNDISSIPVAALESSWVNTNTQREVSRLVRRFNLRVIEQGSVGVGLRQKKDGSVEAAEYKFLARHRYKGVYSVLASTFSSCTGSKEQESDNPLLQMYAWLDTFCQEKHGPDARFLDALTFEAVVKANFPEEEAVAAAELLCRVFFGAEATQVSSLYVLEHIKSCGGLKRILSVEKDGCYHQRLVGGAQGLASCLAAQLPSQVVNYSTVVTKITQKKAEGICLIETASGGAWTSKRVILATPTAHYRTISFDPPLPPSKRMLATTSTMIPRVLSRAFLVYDTPWWREAGFSGSMESARGPIIFTQESRLVVFREEQGDCNKKKKDLYAIECYISGKAGREWIFGELSAQEKEDQLLAQMVDVFGANVDKLPKPLAILPMLSRSDGKDEATDQTSDRYHEAVPALPEGILTECQANQNLEKISEPFENVYFVGAEFATEWRGQMEGALQSGIRGAREVLGSLQKIGQGWQAEWARL